MPEAVLFSLRAVATVAINVGKHPRSRCRLHWLLIAQRIEPTVAVLVTDNVAVVVDVGVVVVVGDVVVVAVVVGDVD